MNNLELQFLAMLDEHTKYNFLGVFSSNTLPKIDHYPSALIINNKPSSHPGEHWLALYFNDKQQCIFFDSFGLSPSYHNFHEYIKRHSINYDYNDQMIQSIFSNYCGVYAIYFIICMTHDLTLTETTSPFTKDYDRNDQLVSNLVAQYFKHVL